MIEKQGHILPQEARKKKKMIKTSKTKQNANGKELRPFARVREKKELRI
jgi:hypothetical protein